LESYYSLSYTVVSLVFLAAFLGYSISALLTDPLHHRLGQRGAAFLSPACRLVCYIILSLHLPWAVNIVSIVICGLGNGITEGAWNSWLGGMEGSNQLLGILHGFYGLGATISPVVATAMVQRYGRGWWEFYYILIGMNVLECALSTAVFWSEDGKTFRERLKLEHGEDDQGGRTKEALKQKLTWLVAVFLFIYVGAEGMYVVAVSEC
jgi:fucose permease